MEHGILCLPCSSTNADTNLLPKQLSWCNTDFEVMPLGCHSIKVVSTTDGYSLVVMVTDLCRHLTYDSRGACHTMYAMLLPKL